MRGPLSGANTGRENEMPRFSIITPVLNGRKYAKQYVQSLKEQLYGNWEALIIDDGCTDGSIDEINLHACGDKRFKFAVNAREKKLRSPYQARNTGLEMARGEFICFLDIDDYWLPSKLETQEEHLRFRPELSLIYGSYIRAGQGKKFGRVRRVQRLLNQQVYALVANPVPMLTSCVRRKVIGLTRFEPVHHEDYIFWSAILKKVREDQIRITKTPEAIYNESNSTLSGNKIDAARWIWLCYRHMGYSIPVSSFAFIVRGALQLAIRLSDKKHDFTQVAATP